MWWRIQRSEFQNQTSEKNHLAMMQIVQSGEVPGVLAFLNGAAVGWCSISPREKYLALERSKTLKRIDDKPVWSVVCFFIAKKYRRLGLTIGLLKAAVDFAKVHGATIVEGYPIEPKGGHATDAHVFMGLVSAYKKAGFVEVDRPSETRRIMWYYIESET